MVGRVSASGAPIWIGRGGSCLVWLEAKFGSRQMVRMNPGPLHSAFSRKRHRMMAALVATLVGSTGGIDLGCGSVRRPGGASSIILFVALLVSDPTTVRRTAAIPRSAPGRAMRLTLFLTLSGIRGRMLPRPFGVLQRRAWVLSRAWTMGSSAPDPHRLLALPLRSARNRHRIRQFGPSTKCARNAMMVGSLDFGERIHRLEETL